MISIVGAGPGAPDLITVRGAGRLRAADTVIYAGSLVNPALLGLCGDNSSIYNSAELTLEEVMEIMRRDHGAGREIVRLHTGDPSIFGAIREQIDILKKENIPFEIIPGVSSFCGAAASLQAEYTLPGVSQTVIITQSPRHFLPARTRRRLRRQLCTKRRGRKKRSFTAPWERFLLQERPEGFQEQR